MTPKIRGERIATDLVQRVFSFTSFHSPSPATVQSLEQDESFFFFSLFISPRVSYFSNSRAEPKGKNFDRSDGPHHHLIGDRWIHVVIYFIPISGWDWGGVFFVRLWARYSVLVHTSEKSDKRCLKDWNPIYFLRPSPQMLVKISFIKLILLKKRVRNVKFQIYEWQRATVSGADETRHCQWRVSLFLGNAPLSVTCFVQTPQVTAHFVYIRSKRATGNNTFRNNNEMRHC
jgi:hypothetical protein